MSGIGSRPDHRSRVQSLFALCDREYIATHTFVVPDEEMKKYVALPIGARIPRGAHILQGGQFRPVPETIIGARVCIGNFFFARKDLFVVEAPEPKALAPKPAPVLALPEPERKVAPPVEDNWTRIKRELCEIEARLR